MNYRKMIRGGAAAALSAVLLCTGCSPSALLINNFGAGALEISSASAGKGGEESKAGEGSSDSEKSGAESGASSEDASSEKDGASSSESGSSKEGELSDSGSGKAEKTGFYLAEFPESYNFDYDGLDAKIEELSSAAESGDADKALDIYDECLKLITEAYSNWVAHQIASDADVTDKSLSALEKEDQERLTVAEDAFLIAVRDACASPNCADAFKGHVGEDYFQGYLDYEDMEDEELDRSLEESELFEEYETALEEAKSDDDLLETAGGIYLKLVKMRTEEAKEAGYDSYADYAYESSYDRAYSCDDAQALCDAVKKYSKDFVELESLGSSLFSYEDVNLTGDELVGKLRDCVAEIGDFAAEGVDYMQKNGLYDGGSGSGRLESCYTACGYSTMTPYIFQTYEGARNFTTISHEFGHFMAYYEAEAPDNIFFAKLNAMDVAEMQSNGLQALCTFLYDKVYDEDYLVLEAQAYNIDDLAFGVISGCMIDEFERRVYENPDMTVDECDALFDTVAKEYFGDYAKYYEGYWVQVYHIFEAPLYYISYATSSLPALELFAIGQDDFDKAAGIWKDLICEVGPFETDYFSVIDREGLTRFSDTEGVAKIISGTYDYLDEASTEILLAYYGGYQQGRR